MRLEDAPQPTEQRLQERRELLSEAVFRELTDTQTEADDQEARRHLYTDAYGFADTGVWRVLRLEAEERLARYLDGEDV
jgi:hypothetical protein